MKKIAVILSGCGYLDGSEITEAISCLIALSECGADYQCFAPDVESPAANHLPKSPAPESKRHVLNESARLARGQVKDLKFLKESEFDALVMPGGFGAAKVLCNWAEKGAKAEVNPDLAKAIKDFHNACKPIGAACIAPVLLAKTLGAKNIHITIGQDAETAAEIEKTGARHVKCAVDDYVSDRDHKLLTTPAYMYDAAKPHQVFKGISAMIRELVEMA